MNKTIVIAVLIIVTLLSITYAYFQQTAASKAQMVAEQNMVLAEAAKKEADANAAEAKKQAQIAEIAQMVAVNAKQKEEQALADLARCKGKK